MLSNIKKTLIGEEGIEEKDVFAPGVFPSPMEVKDLNAGSPFTSVNADSPVPATADQAAQGMGGDAVLALSAPSFASAASGFVIVPHYGTSITNLQTSSPALYTNLTNAITSAIQFYEASFTNAVTVTINFGYGELNGTPLSGGALGASSGRYVSVPYATLRNALISHATSADDLNATASVPSTDPTNGGVWNLSLAEAKVLGLTNSVQTDGSVGLGSGQAYTFDPNNRAVNGAFDAIGVLEHEIAEVLGRTEGLGTLFSSSATNIYLPLDLFRYSAANTRQLSAGPGYFSVDNGQTNLAQFNDPAGGGDAADLSGVPGDAHRESVACHTEEKGVQHQRAV